MGRQHFMEQLSQDITTVVSPAVIAHGVNCQNAMGSGVAKALFLRWPDVKKEYHKFEKQVLGQVQFVQVENNLYVANCFTQEFYGRDGKRYASPSAIAEALDKVCSFVKKSLFLPNIVHIPKIGCNLGGLNFEADVEPTIVALEKKHKIEFLIYNWS